MTGCFVSQEELAAEAHWTGARAAVRAGRVRGRRAGDRGSGGAQEQGQGARGRGRQERPGGHLPHLGLRGRG